MGLRKSNADSEDHETERHDSWKSDAPSTTTQSAPLVVRIAGSCGLVACLLLIWHFAFAKPAPVAPATATYITQPPVQPAIPAQPVTPVPVTPQPPTTSVTSPATSVAQPAPPKPVAKDGRQPVEYQPFFPDRWKAKNQSTQLFPWEGERVVLLTTTADLDAKTMDVFLKRLDVGWKLYADLVGQPPRPFKQHNGKVTMACVPDPSFTCGAGCGYIGMNGIEIAGFYRGFNGGPGDYDAVHKDPELFFDYYFYEMGRNYCLFFDQISLFSTGFSVAMRHVCMEDVKKWKDQDTKTRGWIDRFEEEYSKSNVPFEQAFPPFGAKTPLKLNDIDGKPFEHTDLTILYASGFLKLRKDNGGNEWVRRFHRHLFDCPPSAPGSLIGAKGQLLNWVVAASLAAGKDLTPMFRDRWRFPFAPEVWQALKSVDWEKPGQTANQVFDALPSEHLLPSIALERPNYLTPERRKQNLLVAGSFEGDAASKWKLDSFRANKQSGAIQGDVVKEGQKAAVLRTTINDDTRFTQTVTIKPGTRYLLSGWIKTKDVEIDKDDRKYGKAGATLSLWGGYEHSRSLTGTNDWTYSTLIFDSRDRTEVVVLARLGYWYSTASGEAWFDDLCLIPIGESPARPTAPVPAATITTNKDWNGWSKDAPPPAITPFDAAQAKLHQEAWAKHLGVPVEYTNSIGMKFRLIPPGEFLMGSTAAEIEEALKFATGYHSWHRDPIRSEAPQHKVVLTQPIYMGTWEVTQGDYEKMMGRNPSEFSSTGKSKMAVAGKATTNHPVEQVTWNDAAEFCAKLCQHEQLKPFYSRAGITISSLDGNGYRLPTEAEWEFACRAGTVTKFWSGDKDEDLAKVGWVAGNAGNRTHAAAELMANPFGLYDMHGNAWEWVQDGWDATTYSQPQAKPAIDPACPFSGNSRRVVRSGGVVHAGSFGRSANRAAIEPLTLAGDRGFRVILRVEAVKTALANPVKAEAEPKQNQNAASTWKGWSKDTPAPAIAPFDAAQATQHQEEWAKHLGLPVEYTNSIGMKFRLIPPGEFMMGSTAEEVEAALSQEGLPRYLRDCIQSEAPRHKVILTQPIYHGVNEVTQAEYETVIGKNPSHFAPQGRGKDAVTGLETKNHPIETVGWTDAVEFCESLARREGRLQKGFGYRLPTEAEWEFACRAGTTTKYWIGDNEDDLRPTAWYDKNSGQRTHPVGELKANPFGLFDMHGNVWEWVQDGWELTYYEPFRDKTAIDPLNQPPTGSKRVFRGGNWFNTAPACRSPSRIALDLNPPYRHYHLGIRPALSVEAVKFAMANPVQAEAPLVENHAKESLTLKGHTDLIHGVAFSPDGKLVASASWDRTVKVWDTVSGQETRTLNSSFGQAMSVAFSPNGKRLAVVTPNKLQVWGLMTDQEPLTMEGQSGGNCVAFSPDGRRLAVGDGKKSVKLWDSMSGQLIRTMSGHSGRVSSVAFSPDGKRLASAGGYNGLREPVEVKLWDAASGQETLTLNGHLGGVNSVAFSPDGKRLASAGDKEVTLWDTSIGQESLKIKGFAQCHCITFSPDGTRLASAHGDHSVKVWDATTGQVLLSSKGHLGAVRSVVFSPDGKRLASGSVDQTVIVWDASKALPEREGDQVLFTFKGHTAAVSGIAFFPDGKRLASAGWDQAVRVWDAMNGQELLTLKGEFRMFNSVTISPDGKRLAAASDDNQPVTIWDATNGRELLALKVSAGMVRSVVFSPDGKRLAGAGHDQTVRVWDAMTGQETLTMKGHSGEVFCVRFSPDGSWMASGSHDKSVKVWDATTGEEQRTFAGHPENIWAIAFSPDGKRLAAGTSQSTVTVWEVASGREVFALKGDGQWVQSLAFSPDGTRLAVGHAQSQLRIWDLKRTPKPLLLRGHWGQVSGLAFSPDGTRLASASSDKTVKIRDLAPLTARQTAIQDAARNWKGWPQDVPAPTIAPFDATQAKQHQDAWAKHLGVPVEYTNSIGMKFRLIPPGEFQMGASSEFIEATLKESNSNAAYQEKLRSQTPPHKVILTQPIYLGIHEVTQGQYETLTGNKPSHFAATGTGREAVNGLETKQHPVDTVSWPDAAEFCTKLSEREKFKPFDPSGKPATQQRDTGYRLPTEAEWEFACRAGTVTTFWPGNSDEELIRGGWFGTNSGNRTHAVGELAANSFGLHDTHGNVWEWVLDAFDLSEYEPFENAAAIDPTGPAPTDSQRGLRGGSWQYRSRDCWSSFRHSESASLRHRNIGFRVALPIEAVKAALANPVQGANAKARQKEAEGDKHREQQDYAQAIACYREVVQQEPNNAAILNRLAWVLAVSPQKDQPADEALKFVRRASQEQPNNGFYRNTLGAAQFRSGQFAEALGNLVAVAESPPKNFGWLSHNLFFQAMCHEKRGDRPSAQAAYGKALELLKNASGDTHRWKEARLLQKEVASLIVEK